MARVSPDSDGSCPERCRLALNQIARSCSRSRPPLSPPRRTVAVRALTQPCAKGSALPTVLRTHTPWSEADVRRRRSPPAKLRPRSRPMGLACSTCDRSKSICSGKHGGCLIQVIRPLPSQNRAITGAEVWRFRSRDQHGWSYQYTQRATPGATAIRARGIRKDRCRVGHTIPPSHSGRQASSRRPCCHKESAMASRLSNLAWWAAMLRQRR